MTSKPKVIAFYLPQFHTTPENDEWWGEGFTEWTNTVQGKKQFDDHYQPHIPGELGFYDLRVPETRERQAWLAKEHGIDAFLYYHYWFDEHRVLNRQVDEIRRSGSPQFPFALCWANETWHKRWVPGEGKKLISQRYSETEAARHIEYLVDVFSDPNYLAIDGRPLFCIYRPDIETHSFIEDLRLACKQAGLGDPYLIMFWTYSDWNSDPSEVGCDASGVFLPHGLDQLMGGYKPPEGANPAHRYLRYDEVADRCINREKTSWTVHECVFPGWDNTSRRGHGNAMIVYDNTPDSYQRWFSHIYAAEAAKDPGIVFINAWNEWAEGAHLEPDLKWGRAFLEATARVVGVEPSKGNDPKLWASEPERPDAVQGQLADAYLDVYDRCRTLQRMLTEREDLIDREVRRVLRDLNAELWRERVRSDALASHLDQVLKALEKCQGPSASPEIVIR